MLSGVKISKNIDMISYNYAQKSKEIWLFGREKDGKNCKEIRRKF